VRLYCILKQLNADIVVQIVAGAYTGIVAAYCKMQRVPMMWLLASDSDVSLDANVGLDGPFRRVDLPLFRYGARSATNVVAQTYQQAEKLQEVYGRAPLEVIYSFHEKLGHQVKKRDRFTVVWIGNVKPLKRPELFIQLASKMQGFGIEFKLAGRIGTSTWCAGIARSMDGIHGLEYLGELDMDGVNELLESSHLLVNTSTYEGLPNVFIQAWMREVPTMSLGVDPDNIIRHESVGAVCASIEEMEQRIHEVFHDPRRRNEMGKRARRFSEATCSMENVARLSSLIDKTMLASDPTASEQLN